jgi:hypothetical protein
VTIVGERHVGDVDQVLVRQARRLADAAGVDLLAVRFSGAEPGARFVCANPWPDITPADVADAVLAYLDKGSIPPRPGGEGRVRVDEQQGRRSKVGAPRR